MKLMNPVTLRPEPEDAREARLLMVLNIMLAYVLALMHTSKSLHSLDWKQFIDLEGTLPFQSRLLPFLIAHGLESIQPLSPRSINRLFLAFDFAGALIAAKYILKTVRIVRGTRAMALFTLILFWWQVFATFVASPVHNYYYPYDLLSVGIISMGTWAVLANKSIRLLTTICIIGMINRETAILIPAIYLTANWPCHREIFTNFLKLLITCLIAKIIIHIALTVQGEPVLLYANPGELRFFYNFTFLTFKSSAMHTFNVFFAFGGAWILLLLRGAIPANINQMAWCFLPYFIGMAVVGNLSEIRIFSEFIPLLSLMLGCKLASDPKAPRLIYPEK